MFATFALTVLQYFVFFCMFCLSFLVVLVYLSILSEWLVIKFSLRILQSSIDYLHRDEVCVIMYCFIIIVCFVILNDVLKVLLNINQPTCQYQCKWLPGKTLLNDVLYLDRDIYIYISLTHSLNANNVDCWLLVTELQTVTVMHTAYLWAWFWPVITVELTVSGW